MFLPPKNYQSLGSIKLTFKKYHFKFLVVLASFFLLPESSLAQQPNSFGLSLGEIPKKICLSNEQKKELFESNLLESKMPALKQNETVKDFVQTTVDRYNSDIINGKIIFGTEENNYLDSIAKKIILANPNLGEIDLDFYFERNYQVNATCHYHKEIRLNVGLFSYVHNEAELAFVVAHEISHYVLFHTAKSIVNHESLYSKKDKPMGKIALLNSLENSRKHELEADSLGLILMRNAGYDEIFALNALKVLYNSDQSYIQSNFDINSVFEENYFIPKLFSSPEIIVVQRDDDYLEQYHTHPSIQTRIDKLSSWISLDSVATNGFLISKEKFDDIQEKMRILQLELLLVENDFTEAFYNSYSLLEIYPKRIRELKIIMVKALYGMTKFKTGNQIGAIIHPINRTPGQKQKLIHFYKELDQNQMTGIALKFLFENQAYFENPAIPKAMIQSLYSDLKKSGKSQPVEFRVDRPDSAFLKKVEQITNDLSNKEKFELRKEVADFYLYGFSNSNIDFLNSLDERKQVKEKIMLLQVVINQSNVKDKNIQKSLEKTHALAFLNYDNSIKETFYNLPLNTEAYNNQVKVVNWLNELYNSQGLLQPLVYQDFIKISAEYKQIVHLIIIYNNGKEKSYNVRQTFLLLDDYLAANKLDFDNVHVNVNFNFTDFYTKQLNKLANL
ncbi:MAG: M48 family metallopeptidase [Crocinitomicaceae bacterium]